MDENSSTVIPQKKSPLPTAIVLILGALFVVVWVAFLRPSISLKQATQAAGVGQALPALELQPLTGASEGVSLESVRGKVALINYWGTWCPPCVMEFPHMVELWDEFRGNPEFAFLSVSSSGTNHENVPELKEETEKFLKSHGTTFPTYVDPDGGSRQILASVADMGGFGYPTTVLLDRAGIIRALWVGYQPGYEKQMQQLISQLLAEKK